MPMRRNLCKFTPGIGFDQVSHIWTNILSLLLMKRSLLTPSEILSFEEISNRKEQKDWRFWGLGFFDSFGF